MVLTTRRVGFLRKRDLGFGMWDGRWEVGSDGSRYLDPSYRAVLQNTLVKRDAINPIKPVIANAGRNVTISGFSTSNEMVKSQVVVKIAPYGQP